MTRSVLVCLISALFSLPLHADLAPSATPPAAPEASAAQTPAGRAPTLTGIAYGEHPRQVLNFWKAESATSTAVVVHMHGGGWTNGDRKKTGDKEIERLLAAGVSYVSISYRLVPQAREARVSPAVSWPMHDAARAVQFVRSKAAEWNIDKTRVAMTGTSAGACSSLWVAFHDDLADARSADPVARESTRLRCVAVDGAQTSLDPAQMQEWIPNIIYGGHAFGFNSGKAYEARVAAFAKFLENRESVREWIREYSPYDQATAGDPPVYLYYNNKPSLGQPQKDATHSANFGVKLKEKLDGIGVPCELVYPGAAEVRHPTITDYLIEKLHAGS